MWQVVEPVRGEAPDDRARATCVGDNSSHNVKRVKSCNAEALLRGRNPYLATYSTPDGDMTVRVQSPREARELADVQGWELLRVEKNLSPGEQRAADLRAKGKEHEL